ncbi:hypothetical protein ACW9I6_31815, partial [Pseudomonas sp. SDO5522_S412]
THLWLIHRIREQARSHISFLVCSLTWKSIKPPVCGVRQMVIPGAVYLRYYGILRGLRPVQPALIRTTSHAGFPAWLVVF